MQLNLYDVLGISRTASKDDIKLAYRNKANEHHPDKNEGSKESEETFKKIRSAYDTLIDDFTRKIYDCDGGIDHDPLFIESTKRLSEQVIIIILNQPDVEQIDVLALMRTNIKNWIIGLNTDKDRIQNNRKIFTNMKDKFIKLNGGYNVLSEAIGVKINLIDSDLSEIKHMIDVAEMMQKILKGYDFRRLMSFYVSGSQSYQ